mmetsp:Transcript_2678/g.4124  ORF Transcript_2678/g.4124 Transcript_2678/m.4124 type:complete len:125 (+) Transcript_2678:642-1016(+)
MERLISSCYRRRSQLSLIPASMGAQAVSTSQFEFLLEGFENGVQVVWQLDRRIGQSGIYPFDAVGVVSDLRVGELQSVSCRHNHHSVISANHLSFPELDECSQCYTGVRAVEHTRPVCSCSGLK